MTDIASAAALLHTAIQDLHAGKRLMVDRLPPLAGRVANGELADVLASEASRANEQADRLAGAGVDTAGPKNL